MNSPKTAMLLLLCAVVSACGPKAPTITIIDGFAQGTTYHIVLKGDREYPIKPQLDSIFRLVDMSMSLHEDSSLISRLNRGETDSVDRMIAHCITVAKKLSQESGGLYDITIQPISRAYGFAGGKHVANVDDINIDSLRQFVGYDKIAVENGRLVKADPRVEIDLSSIAQGLTADVLGQYIESLGITEYLAEIGGEIFCRGTNATGDPWRVGIDRPSEGNFTPGAELQAKISLSGKGLATSGNYRKFYTDEHGHKIVHMIDPTTGRCVISNLLSVTVVADDATLADAYGTMFMVIGLDASKEFLASRPDIQAYMVYTDDKGNYQTYMTPVMESYLIK